MCQNLNVYGQQGPRNKQTNAGQKRQQTNNCNQQTNKPDVAKVAFESLQLLLEQQTNAKKSNKKGNKQTTATNRQTNLMLPRLPSSLSSYCSSNKQSQQQKGNNKKAITKRQQTMKYNQQTHKPDIAKVAFESLQLLFQLLLCCLLSFCLLLVNHVVLNQLLPLNVFS